MTYKELKLHDYVHMAEFLEKSRIACNADCGTMGRLIWNTGQDKAWGWVAWNEDKPVGWCIYTLTDSTLFIEQMYALPEYQSSMLGATLCLKAIRRARQLGLHSVSGVASTKDSVDTFTKSKAKPVGILFQREV